MKKLSVNSPEYRDIVSKLLGKEVKFEDIPAVPIPKSPVTSKTLPSISSISSISHSPPKQTKNIESHVPAKGAKMRSGPKISEREYAIANKYAAIIENWAHENDNILTYEDEEAFGEDFTYRTDFTNKLSEILESYKLLSTKDKADFTKRNKKRESEMQKAMKIMYGYGDSNDEEDYVDVNKDPELQQIILKFLREAAPKK